MTKMALNLPEGFVYQSHFVIIEEAALAQEMRNIELICYISL